MFDTEELVVKCKMNFAYCHWTIFNSNDTHLENDLNISFCTIEMQRDGLRQRMRDEKKEEIIEWSNSFS